MKRKYKFCGSIIIGVIIFCFSTTQTKAQIVDTIFTTTGWITSIELIKTNPGKILIGNMGTSVSISQDYGQTWVESQFDTPRPGCYDISFDHVDAQVGFLGGATSLYKTTDGGYNWFNTNQLEYIYFVDVNPQSPNIIFAQGATIDPIGPPYYLYISTDYGETWEDSLLDYWILDLQFHPTNDSIAFGYNERNILKTTDLGKSWEAILTTNNIDFPFTSLSVSKNIPGVLYAGKIGSILKTTNDGNNWFPIGSSSIPSSRINSILLDETNPGRLFIGLREGLFLTEDDGENWRQIFNGRIYLIKADDDNPRNIYCTTDIERTAIRLVDTFTVTGVNTPQNLLPERFYLFPNYPNPFNPITTIRYSIKERGFVQLKVYDGLGKEVAVLVNKEKQQGNYSVSFDGVNLPSGVYIYTLHVKDFMKSRKMVLLR